MLTSGPPHRGSSICTCHWQLSEDRLGTPRSGFQPLLSQNNHQHQAHHCQIVVIASSAENRHLAAKWVCPRPYSEGQQLTDVISSSANNQQATAPPPLLSPGPQQLESFCLGRRNRACPPLHPAAFGKRKDLGPPINLDEAPPLLSPGPHPPASAFVFIGLAPNHLEPSASADGIDHLPPYTQLPLQNETTRVDPSTSATHPPRFSPQAPNHLEPSASADGIDHLPPYTQLPFENKTTRVDPSTSATHPPPFSPQAPNHLEPSASADGIDHLPPYTQLPLQNETTRVDPSTSATHPPPRSLPRPPTTWSLLPRPTESTISPPTPSCLLKTKQPGSTHRPRRRTPPSLSRPPASRLIAFFYRVGESIGFFYRVADLRPLSPPQPTTGVQPPPPRPIDPNRVEYIFFLGW
ncbi:hypothetical protein PGTUg99_027814 [Puccinia graminis f. sp. tritici]|uniref:Uncharacterized protein n=1 Tax=Puccinia graminis f. sp. tritici TaxID=56615 RepID=A0A5B0P1W7_PUCGR|nr:hypothetical protein PGTUg99_027814 [Puccinia graminis f. sp. tritici]